MKNKVSAENLGGFSCLAGATSMACGIGAAGKPAPIAFLFFIFAAGVLAITLGFIGLNRSQGPREAIVCAIGMLLGVLPTIVGMLVMIWMLSFLKD